MCECAVGQFAFPIVKLEANLSSITSFRFQVLLLDLFNFGTLALVVALRPLASSFA